MNPYQDLDQPGFLRHTGLRSAEIVEFTRHGNFVRTFSIDSAAGSAFALDEQIRKDFIQFSYVDDAEATLTILRLTH
jgi:hypothetical protein